MIFASPWLLLGGLAAGIPIALHFFYRSRYRTVPWAAMRFLLASIEQTSRRLKFQELLLLILRVVLLLVLAFALARPTGRGAGEAVDAVFLLDTSASMAARDGEKSRWERAQDAALAVLDQLPPHSTVRVVTCSNRAFLHSTVPTNFDQARRLIRELQPSDLGSDLLPGAREAMTAMQRGNSPNREVYVFSDMHKRAWEQSAGLGPTFRQLRERATLYFVRCATHSPPNVAIVGLGPQWSLPRAEQRTSFSVLLRNTGKDPVRNLTLSLAVNGKREAGDTVPVLGDAKGEQSLAPGETRAFAVPAKLGKPGLCVVTARVEPDGLDRDNRFDQVILAHEQPRILLIDGAPNERSPERAGSFFLGFAFHPIPVDVTTPGQATPVSLATKDVCVLCNVSLDPGASPAGRLSERFLEALEGFVRDGKPLIVVLGDQVKPATYNRLLFDQHRLLPARLGNLLQTPDDKPLTFDRKTAVGPYTKFRDEAAYRGLDRVEFRRLFRIDDAAIGMEDGETQALLRFSDGSPAVLRRQRTGEGDVILVTTSMGDLAWTDWPVDPSFVPFVQTTLQRLLDAQTPALNHKVGDTLTWAPPPREVRVPYLLVRPDGQRTRLGLPTGEKVPHLTTGDTPLAGTYRMVPEDAALDPTRGVTFAVTPDLSETEDLSSATDVEIDDLLGFTPIHALAGQDAASWASAARLKSEWATWVLILLFVLVLGETVLAWFCGRAW